MGSGKHLLVQGTLLFLAAGFTACADRGQGPAGGQTADYRPMAIESLVFDRLTGTWQTEDGKTFEKWSKSKDGTYRSVVFSVKGKDTLWKEEANIYPDKGQWIFENKVSGQNNGQPITFRADSISATHVRFGNPAHDFPTAIHYTVEDINQADAFITGPDNKGGEDTIFFAYKRVR